MKRLLVEFGLVVAGIAILSKTGWDIYQYQRFQGQLSPSRFAALTSAPYKGSENISGKHAIIGQLLVPRLRMSAAMVEGDDEESLSLAAGHMPGTAPIGSNGNTVVAGHRDTVFWPLRNIKRGDRIIVLTGKKYVYTVERTQIVTPEDTDALQDTNSATLTMVTCYPFRHVGPSPKRFVVTAKLLRIQN